jgi:hypothetical protein
MARCLVAVVILVLVLLITLIVTVHVYRKALDLVKDSGRLDQYSIVQHLTQVFVSALLLLIVMMLLLLVAVLLYALIMSTMYLCSD